MVINQTVPANCATPSAAGSARHNVVAMTCSTSTAWMMPPTGQRRQKTGLLDRAKHRSAVAPPWPTFAWARTRSLAGERPAGFRTITGMLSRVSHVVGRGMAGEQRCHGAGTVGSLRLSGFLCSIPSPKQGSNSAFVVELLVELPYPGYAGHDRPRHGVGHLPLDG